TTRRRRPQTATIRRPAPATQSHSVSGLGEIEFLHRSDRLKRACCCQATNDQACRGQQHSTVAAPWRLIPTAPDDDSLSSSWPDLFRPSTSLMLFGFQDVDARDKRGHDESVTQAV